MITSVLVALLTQVPLPELPAGFSARIAGTSEAFRGPGGLAVDQLGRIVVQDPYGGAAFTDRFFSIAPDGEVATLTVIAGAFCWSSQVAMDLEGNAYSFDIYRNRLLSVAPSGAETSAAIGLNGGASCDDSGAIGVVYHPIDDRIYLSSPLNRAIYRVENGTAVLVASNAGMIYALAVLPDGSLVGSDPFAGNLVRIDRTTGAVTIFAAVGPDVHYGIGIAVSPAGDVFAVAHRPGGEIDLVRVENGQPINFTCGVNTPMHLAFGPGTDGVSSLFYGRRGATIDANDGDAILEINGAAFTTGDVPLGCTTCGDGVAEGSEACDDGNLAQLDGCDASCAIEPFETPWSTNEYGRSFSGDGYHYALGYHFRPLTGGYVTHLGARINGSKIVRLFDRDTQQLIAETTVSGAYDWNFSPIAPVYLEADEDYTVAVYLQGTGGVYNSHLNLPQTFGNIYIFAGAFAETTQNPNAFPFTYTFQAINGQADIRFLPREP